MRNRRYKQKLGPLVIYGQDAGIARAFRNIPGVDILNVERLNLLKVAPGGHLGRMVIWTESAFKKLDAIYGTHNTPSELKKGFVLPTPKMSNPDFSRIIRSEEVVKAVRPARKASSTPKVFFVFLMVLINNFNVLQCILQVHRNPLKKISLMTALNPYAASLKAAAKK